VRSRLAEGWLRATSIVKGFWLAIVCIARGKGIVEGRLRSNREDEVSTI
jgi:hypothetical protein